MGGDVFSSLVAWRFGCNLFGELFPLIVPFGSYRQSDNVFLQQHPTD